MDSPIPHAFVGVAVACCLDSRIHVRGFECPRHAVIAVVPERHDSLVFLHVKGLFLFSQSMSSWYAMMAVIPAMRCVAMVSVMCLVLVVVSFNGLAVHASVVAQEVLVLLPHICVDGYDAPTRISR